MTIWTPIPVSPPVAVWTQTPAGPTTTWSAVTSALITWYLIDGDGNFLLDDSGNYLIDVSRAPTPDPDWAVIVTT